MANQPVKISEEPVTNSISGTDRFVVVFNANTTSPSVRTITANNLGLPVTSNASANGYTSMPNGILMQWGWVLSNSTVGDITFSTAFTTSVFSIQLTVANTTVSSNLSFQVIASNTTTANVRSANTGNPGANVMYLAIGK